MSHASWNAPCQQAIATSKGAKGPHNLHRRGGELSRVDCSVQRSTGKAGFRAKTDFLNETTAQVRNVNYK